MNADSKCHVAVFPLPFSSHPTPMLNLALKLALEACHVRFSFFNTAKSNASLFSQPNHRLSLPENFKAYDVDDGVPAGHIITGHPLETVDLFLGVVPECYKTAVDSAVAETRAKVTCLLTDAFLTSAADFARDHLNGVPWIALLTPFPCFLSAFLHTELIRTSLEGTDSKANQEMELDFVPGLSGIRVKDLPLGVVKEFEEDSLFLKELSLSRTVLPRDSSALVLKFYSELSPAGLNQDLESKFRKVLKVGFLRRDDEAEAETEEDRAIMTWLEDQKEGSVAYVSFGTAAALPRNETVALAEALEESGIGFLWSLKDRLKVDLPEGFEERTSGRGKVVAWAPQMHVLRHRSVGVFVTHGGSNSVYESISGEVPMICRPFFGDQLLLAQTVEKVWKIGLKIEAEKFTKNEVIKSLDVVLGQEHGMLMRENVRKLNETLLEAASPKGSASTDFKALVGLVSSIDNITKST